MSEPSTSYQPSAPEPKSRRRNAVPTLLDADRIPEGTLLHFKARGQREREFVDPWLAVDPRRRQATWVHHRTKPLLWLYDGHQYSPSGLQTKIREQSGWPNHPDADHGPGQWYVPGEGSLWDLAEAIQDGRAVEG
ncbi:hypothetical protein [Actinoallomurus sp. NPDC052274]|uniref:hypothetical protein n=1 Tax=Actinoallomurus sp. NPDC052274 TaxID=3155420 RepID=UPI003422A9F5